MTDKICCGVYKAIKLIDWIILGLFSVALVIFIISFPSLFYIYIGEGSFKSSIMFGLVFWTVIALAFAIDFAYTRGKDLEQTNKI